MLTNRSVLALVALVALSVAGCASDPGATDDDPASGTDAVTTRPCLATDSALFFHGLSGYGRELATSGLCVPSVGNSGANGFWSDVAFIPAPAATIVGGYSAGRLPLVRRLAKGEGSEQTAVMLDPSYSDGPRFEGRTGPAIVDEWLDRDAARRFVLVYSPSSTGWSEYAALATGVHADQVKVCSVTGSHLELPRVVTSQLFVDPATWVTQRCTRP
jgi:hypothetical protein